MVDFSGIRRESEPTFFFFARALERSFRHALEECQATGWQIMTKREALAHLPEDFEIPEVRISPGAPRVEKSVRAFVSYFNLEELARKFEAFQYDGDRVRWENEAAGRAAKQYALEEKRAQDPPPYAPFGPGREEAKTTISGVRRGKEPTFFFFPKQYLEDFAHYLDEQEASGWEIRTDMQSFLRFQTDGFEIPAVRLYPDGPVTEDVAVFISYFDPADMERKLTEILTGGKAAAWKEEARRQAERREAYERKWRGDPPPFPKPEAARTG